MILDMSMVTVLDDLLNDNRLMRLFSNDARHCALQLWILQIKSEQSTENRVVYGRLLPYNYSDDQWHSRDDDNFQDFKQFKAQVVRLNLYVKSSNCINLLRQLSAGKTISAISEDLKLKLSESINTRFGMTTLVTSSLAYRPVVFLLNRDAYDLTSLTSPHGAAGAISASISQTDKRSLFRIGENYCADLTSMIVKRLDADTGLNFGGNDTIRFGDIELLVFPALDDYERSLLSVDWSKTPSSLIAKFNPMQVPHFNCFQFRVSILNDGQMIYSGITTAERNIEGVFEGNFMLSDQLRIIADSAELEVFGFHDNLSREGILCCRSQIAYIRKIQFDCFALRSQSTPVKFDWLEKTTRPSESTRVQAALTTGHDNPCFSVTEDLQKAANVAALQLPSSFVTTLFASGFAEATAVWFNAPEA